MKEGGGSFRGCYLKFIKQAYMYLLWGLELFIGSHKYFIIYT